MNLTKRYDDIKRKIHTMEIERNLKQKSKAELEQTLVKLEETSEYLSKAAIVSQQLAECKRGAMNKMFSETVTGALKDTFDSSYQLELDYGIRNNRSTCDFTLTTSEYVGFLPLKMCHGKSVSQIISVVLRIMLVNVVGGDLLVLDEPLEGLELPRVHTIAKFLNDITKKFDIQLIMVSFYEPIINSADNVFNVSKRITQ